MVAARRPNVPLGSVSSDLWTYEVCTLPAPGANACPTGKGEAGLGGVRLQLQPGDTLRVRLVNDLPVVIDADHDGENPSLANNPTNLHTHGLIVEPHRAVSAQDAYGDYVFVEVTNPANNAAPPSPAHPGMDVAEGAVQYEYSIDATHPPGLYWFHPHLHGLALNQVTAGMAGILTIGSVADECADAACASAVQQSTVRHIVLKDTQVAKGNALISQPDPGFCDGAAAAPRQGSCQGQGPFAGGSWVHTVNGQVYPQITVGGAGEIWRILNAAGSRSYQLSVVDTNSGRRLPMQVIAIDGITIGVPRGKGNQVAAAAGGRLGVVPCPGGIAAGNDDAICAETLRMMPSSRVEVRLLRKDNGAKDVSAVFRTDQYDTGEGDGGDHWPAIDLAAVTMSSRKAAAPDQVSLRPLAQAALATTGQLLATPTLKVPGTTTTVPATSATAATTASTSPVIQPSLVQASTAAITPQLATGKVSTPNCKPLAPGHHRKILFGFPNATAFGLGYVEVDQNGREMENTRIPIKEFDATKPMVCVPLPGGSSVSEVWELVNITSEDHNFHIHQTRFHLLTGGVAPGTVIPRDVDGARVLLDNVPVPRPTPPANAAACDGTLDAVRSGACKPTSTFVLIPFREIGDFVFHCHILEHEDGGMMARIRVALSPTS
jgi:FtsP/CotA-like multicopper oxidase with cupredoxin domain